MNAKIIGAGSVGNHLTHACRRLGWHVTVIDSDPEALKRMRDEIYPRRYGAWDPAITLYHTSNEPVSGFDVILVGTPPDVRMRVATRIFLDETPQLIHLEKPLCTPSMEGVREFLAELALRPQVMVTIGYNHSVSPSIQCVLDILKEKRIGNVRAIDVEFREHWRGIFAAHPWLQKPEDSYLGSWRRGGGAGGEQSHGIHLWQLFAYAAGWGRVHTVDAIMDFEGDKDIARDVSTVLTLKTENSGIGCVVLDLVSYPARKRARILAEHGYVEWIYNGTAEGDLVEFQIEGCKPQMKVFSRNRPDDFYFEICHYDYLLRDHRLLQSSPLAFDRGLETISVLAAAHESQRTDETISVEYLT